jgi:hypothetical protein
VKLNKVIFELPFYFFSGLVILISFVILVNYGWWFYSTSMDREGMNGSMYIYYANFSKSQFLFYTCVISLLALFFILIQIFSLLNKKTKMLTRSYVAFIVFIIVLTLFEELKHVGKG